MSRSHVAPKTKPKFQAYRWRLLEGLFETSAWGPEFLSLKRALEEKKDPTGPYLALWRLVVERQEFIAHPMVGNAFQDLMLENLLNHPNALHRKAESVDAKDIGSSVRDAYALDLETFCWLLQTDWESLARQAAKREALPSFNGIQGGALPSPLPLQEAERRDFKTSILSSKIETKDLVKTVCRYFRRNGFGLFARHRAFRWEKGRLEPAGAVDPVRLADLKGYDTARQSFLDNLEGFVSGHPANNVLLYGERGTGKSSTVKAALNEYAERGLRLVELSPLDALDVATVFAALRHRPERFMLFLDDLSFNDDDVRYRGLKALLEGSVEPLPTNVILVATSNRRHLMPETFAEREGGTRVDGEIHQVDAVEEKLSLSDRFGLVVSFYSPDQETYLVIVRHLAEKAYLQVPRHPLEAGALRWAMENNGRSGRAAAQYIRHLSRKVGPKVG
jgi:predicted AAA+ superfamily ATPase